MVWRQIRDYSGGMLADWGAHLIDTATDGERPTFVAQRNLIRVLITLLGEAIGQYLRPTVNHLDIQRWVTPEEFVQYREWALAKGFLECVSGPLVRSSYRAERALERNNAGLS